MALFYHVKVPIFVSIVRTLTGKLVLDSQNLISCFQFEENVQKPPKKAGSWKCANLDDLSVWWFWIFYPIMALRSWFKKACFESRHRILWRNLNFWFYKMVQHLHQIFGGSKRPQNQKNIMSPSYICIKSQIHKVA